MKKIIVSVAPKLLDSGKLKSFYNKKRHILRINGAHGTLEDIKNIVENIRSQVKDPKILIDLPGNKIRTKNIHSPIKVDFGSEFVLENSNVTFDGFFNVLKKGDKILAQDSTLVFQVSKIENNKLFLKSNSKGKLYNGKGLHVKGINKNLPFLFKKDLDLIKLANKMIVDFIGLSFVRTKNDVNEAKKLIDKQIEIITKIETKPAVENLNEILSNTKYILIDRGDLSAEVGIEKIPYYQKYIIEKALFHNKKIFLATQFLFNMVDKPIPTIAEVISLYESLKTGILGIQLSEETAIGEYPKECVDIINKIIDQILNEER